MIELNKAECSGKMWDGKNLPKYDKCCLSLSSNKSFSNTSNLKEILEWLSYFYNDILIIEGSYLDRWNLKAIQDIKKNNAEKIITKNVEKSTRRIKRIIESSNYQNKIHLLDWKEIVKSNEYLLIHDKLKKYYNTNQKFQLELKQIIIDFYNKISNNKPNSKQMGFFENYILEEISVLILVYNRGYVIEVYPGADQLVLTKIAKGGYKNFPFDFSFRTHISINLRKTIL